MRFSGPDLTALALLVLGLACPTKAEAEILNVCRSLCDHSTVQGAINAALPGDTIRIASGVYRESLRIDRDLILRGESADSTILDGEGPTTVIVVVEGVTVTLSDVTITSGVGNSGGTTNDAGGIYNRGTLTLDRTVVRGNIAPEDAAGRGKGGGIRNDGTLTVRLGFVEANSAGGRGGGIYNTGSLSMDRVTLCDNSASGGGAIFNEGTASLANCTIVDNIATGDGGGLRSENRLTLVNCTITGNIAGDDGGGLWVGGDRVARTETRLTHCTVTDNEASGTGAGIFNEKPTGVELLESIIADNDQSADCVGAMLSLGHNLDSDNSCNLQASGERPDTPGVRPALSQLGHHGGRTLTHALLPRSPAIDAGPADCAVTTDQTGAPRPVGGRCDIGAYERPGCGLAADGSFRRGDVNADGSVDISDPVSLLISLFLTGSPIACEDAGDANDNGSLNLTDAVFILNWLFLDGLSLPPPGVCGGDPTDDELGCLLVRGCLGLAPAPGVAGGGAQAPRFQDLWTSESELAAKPLAGPAWESVWTAAQDACAGEATVTNQDSNANVQVLAAAMVHARLLSEDPSSARPFRDKVVAALEKLVAEGDPRETHGCPFGCGKAVNETLAWGREVGAYVLAADLVRYRTPAFEAWVRSMAEVYLACDGRTMLRAFQRRPNNWGVMNFGSLVAMYAYLGDEEALREIRGHFVEGLTVGIPDCLDAPDGAPCYNWGGSLERREKDLTWHCNPARPLLIAPACTHRLPDGTLVDFDGLIPDDQRRSCSFCPPGATSSFCASVAQRDRCVRPEWDSHITDWINGAIMGARILDRIGMGIWEVGDRAFKRMIIAHLVTHCQLTCDDTGFHCRSLYNCKDWVLPVLDEVYDLETELTPPPPTACDCPVEIAGRGTGAGKNAGFGAYIVP